MHTDVHAYVQLYNTISMSWHSGVEQKFVWVRQIPQIHSRESMKSENTKGLILQLGGVVLLAPECTVLMDDTVQRIEMGILQ